MRKIDRRRNTMDTIVVLILGFVAGCISGCEEPNSPGPPPLVDQDQDGFYSDVDCNDNDPDIKGPLNWYEDKDGDGVGQEDNSARACDQPPGYASIAGDCDDMDASTTKEQAWYADCDGDGIFTQQAVTACGLAGANAAFTCADAASPDGGWSNTPGTDCNDQDESAWVLEHWYADCDADGAFRATAIQACGVNGANKLFACADAASPDGGWSTSEGDDCNDEDDTAFLIVDWYPDCDADGVFSPTAVEACGVAGANSVFACTDSSVPDGGWSRLPGTDCNDEDATGVATISWYADCDADGVFGLKAIQACGETGANSIFTCADASAPDGGWSDIPGSDCNDEDPTAMVFENWYADCDSDDVFSTIASLACGMKVVNPTQVCVDAAYPDGGWSTVAGNDCNDEDPTAAAFLDWYADCDGDGVFASTALVACGAAGASLTFDCNDMADPDGGWSTTAGTDCNDEDPSAVTLLYWYPDCDGDGVFSSSAYPACGSSAADAAYDCGAGTPPVGGWSTTGGTDCDDQDDSATEFTQWYADCDADGVFSSNATPACGISGANAAFDCADMADPDGGWSNSPGSDCNDEDGSAFVLSHWYPDCDGDGIFSENATSACGSKGADDLFDCADAANPDGGWSVTSGDDCNDEDSSAVALTDWYADCDADGVFSPTPTQACGQSGADMIFDCASSPSPAGGWSTSSGDDCNDEDASAWTITSWYADCDGDGVFSPTNTQACGTSEANTVFACADGADPDGGWSNSPGSDCNDEDASAVVVADWYADCDADGIFSAIATRACGNAEANTLFDCADAADPDGGWSQTPGDDCNDEDPSAAAIVQWYADCDADGIFSTTAIPACNTHSANAVFDCADADDPDGGWSSSQGTDCNDEDPQAGVMQEWYPDCDADGIFASVATSACGVSGANTIFDCADTADPDGGWSTSAGLDCNDEDPNAAVFVEWFADCDGDGVFGSKATLACGTTEADAMTNCADSAPPDGGWASTPGTDCNDEDPTSVSFTSWYADCDEDGSFSPTAILACGTTGANAAFDCADTEDPAGLWSTNPGDDCNDEDPNASEIMDWYPDCDADGSFGASATQACGLAGADNAFDCAHTDSPAGGWSNTPGSDCNDEDPLAAMLLDWYPDCDADGESSSIEITACGANGANMAFDCADLADPDGGWSLSVGSDCNDEDANAVAEMAWFADCDADGVFRSTAVFACGTAGANALFDCDDAQDPDGGWNATAGSDCNDEDGSAWTFDDWYADCDADGAYGLAASRACGTVGANAGFDCADGADPDGGWSATPGTDCDDENANNPCFCGNQDNNADGVCKPVSTLQDAHRLTTGMVDFELSTGTLPVYIDGDYKDGGWVLIGRGREDWDWTDEGRGQAANLAVALGTPSAFSPAYLSSVVIQELIENTGIDLRAVEIRIKRAAKTDGSVYQETLWRSQSQTTWTWLFDFEQYDIDYTVHYSALGSGTTTSGNTRDIQQGNNHTRTFTWGWGSHQYKKGFAYGSSVSGGTADPTNFFWQNGSERHAIPYSEVYIRIPPLPKSCTEVLNQHRQVADGEYTIDPDGPGGNAPFAVVCDMTTAGGGWTVLAHVRKQTGMPYPGCDNTGLDPNSLGYSINANNIPFSQIAITHNGLSEGAFASFNLAAPDVIDCTKSNLVYQQSNGRYSILALDAASSGGWGDIPLACFNAVSTNCLNESRSETYGAVATGGGNCQQLNEDGPDNCGGWGLAPHVGDTSWTTSGGRILVRGSLLPRSCLEILDNNPRAEDGEYEIDPDGVGGNAPVVVTCDMSAGGWTLAYAEDFSSGNASGWHDTSGAATRVDTTSSCATELSNMLGGYGILGANATTEQTFDLGSIPHSQVSVGLDYVVIDSWDGEQAIVKVDGVTVYSTSFTHATATSSICGRSEWNDHGPQKVDLRLAHWASTLSLAITSTLNQEATDESFGVDNIELWIR